MDICSPPELGHRLIEAAYSFGVIRSSHHELDNHGRKRHSGRPIYTFYIGANLLFICIPCSLFHTVTATFQLPPLGLGIRELDHNN